MQNIAYSSLKNDNVNMENNKHAKFQEIAEARTNRVLNDLRLLKNCANRNNYSYTQEEVSQMLKAIEDSVRDLRMAFTSKEKGESVFRFK